MASVRTLLRRRESWLREVLSRMPSSGARGTERNWLLDDSTVLPCRNDANAGPKGERLRNQVRARLRREQRANNCSRRIYIEFGGESGSGLLSGGRKLGWRRYC